MRPSIVSYIFLVMLFAFVSGCSDDKELSIIEGKWSGTKAEFRADLIRITQDELNIGLDFQSHGTLVYTDDSRALSGSWSKTGKKLFITQIEEAALPVNLSGDYEVRELSASQLIIEGERYGEIADPNYGQVKGTMKVLLFFHRSTP
jgi:hypothetical protein